MDKINIQIKNDSELKKYAAVFPTKTLNNFETVSMVKHGTMKFRATTRCCSENQLLSRKTLIYLFVFLLPLAIDVASSAVSNGLHQKQHRIRHSHIHKDVHLNEEKSHKGVHLNDENFHKDAHLNDDKFHTHKDTYFSDSKFHIDKDASNFRHRRFSVPEHSQNGSSWPVKRVAEIYGDIVIGGLHMIHEREDAIICGPVMPQGGLQALMNSNREN